MPKAKKLPSGSWRCRAFAGYTYVYGKKKAVYESFTYPTKAEAEAAAAAWKLDRNNRGKDLTVAEAVERYITAKSAVLSPSTIRGYRTIQRTAFDTIGHVKIRQLDNETVQIWIATVSATRSPKTTRNIFAMLSAAVSMFAPGKTFCVALPANKKQRYNLPPDEDVRALLEYVKGRELWVAIMLSYYYGLRRGEICALSSDDLDENGILTINKDMVADEKNQWMIKDMPKTADSCRSLRIAEPLLSVLRGIDGKYIPCTPNALLARFRRALKFSKVTPFNFHLLRHCYASRAALMGVPDFYLARLGGWKPGSPIMKQVYQNAVEDELARQMDKLNSAIPI